MPASLFTPDIVEQICELIAEGKSLKQIEAMRGMPSKSCVLKWAAKDEDFREKYEAAMVLRTEGFVEEMIEIADRADLKPKDKAVMIAARQWVAGRFVPSKYSEKIRNEFTGKDGAPLTAAVVYLPDNGRD